MHQTLRRTLYRLYSPIVIQRKRIHSSLIAMASTRSPIPRSSSGPTSDDFIPLKDSNSDSDIEVDFDSHGRTLAKGTKSNNSNSKPIKIIPKSKSQIYDNISVFSDHEKILMFKCSSKKASWYLNRNLAISLSDTSIQLTFTPKGQGRSNDPYYLEDRENICVVCGQDTINVGATMLHVVPDQYRKWMPIKHKSHASHDILVACPPCNAKWDLMAAGLRKEIVKVFEVPLEGIGWVKDPEAGIIKRAAGAVITDWQRQQRIASASATIPAITDGIPTDETKESNGETDHPETILEKSNGNATKIKKSQKQSVGIPPERLRELELKVYQWWLGSGGQSNNPADRDDHKQAVVVKRRRSVDENGCTEEGTSKRTKCSIVPAEFENNSSSLSTTDISESSRMTNLEPPLGHETQLTVDMLQSAMKLTALYKAADFQEHGQLVMSRLMASMPQQYFDDKVESLETLHSWRSAKPLANPAKNWINLESFVQTWRRQFLDKSKPQHLSSEWKVDDPI